MAFISKLIPLNEALNRVDSHQKYTNTERININEAHNRILAEDIKSYHNSPPFDKSAMDGYALIAENTFGASNNNYKSYKIIDYIGAGNFSKKTVNENEAIKIATGAPIPKGANAVIMEEFTSSKDNILEIHTQVTPHENISPCGEDFKKGDLILPKKTFIRSQELGLIAQAGHDTVEVYKKPKVKLIITGNELVNPTKELNPAKIINSNQYTIKSLIESAGANVTLTHIGDDFEKVKSELLESSKEYDIIITTGGTAISKGDVVVDAVETVGEVLFHGVALRPGRPVGCGIINDVMVFMLSGQPVAAMTQFDIFARRYLVNMQGVDFKPEIVLRNSVMKIPSKLGRTDFIRTYSNDTQAKHVLNRSSGIIRSMVEANSYIIIDENSEGVLKDGVVKVLFFNNLVWGKY